MSLLSDILGTTVMDGVAKIISLFKVDPNVAEQHAYELEKIRLEMAQKLQESIDKEVEAASANIRAEAQSGDKYTSRARPSFIYLMLAIFGCNYILFPLISKTPLEYPEALFWLFGSVMLGYTGARTWEKFMGMDGESTVKGPFGIEASNKPKGDK